MSGNNRRKNPNSRHLVKQLAQLTARMDVSNKSNGVQQNSDKPTKDKDDPLSEAIENTMQILSTLSEDSELYQENLHHLSELTKMRFLTFFLSLYFFDKSFGIQGALLFPLIHLELNYE